jgi:hypothetical protein
MGAWSLGGQSDGLRLIKPTDVRRSFGDETFTWAKLIYAKLAPIQVFVLYFPSRFDLPLDKSCADLLRAFGKNTPEKTSVNFWDPQDENLAEALKLFDLATPPAVVLATGLELNGIEPQGPDNSDLYSISYSDKTVLADTDRFVSAVNLAHEVLLKGDPKEIAALIRKQNVGGLLAAIAQIASAVRDQLVLLKPKLGLPGGVSLSVG